MKRWIRHQRNVLYISVLLLSMIALLFTTLGHMGQSDKQPQPTSPIQPPVEMGLPSPGESTPAQIQEPSGLELFQLIQQEKFKYIRVLENHQHWDYKPGQPIWYSRGDAVFILSIDSMHLGGITPSQLETLHNNIALTTVAGEPISFSVSKGSNDEQLMISLKGTPATDLSLSFYSPDLSQSKTFRIYYMKTFDYKITSESVPYVDKSFALNTDQYRMPVSILMGKPHEFTFHFTDEVDRKSAVELFQHSLEETTWSVEWIDNRTMKLLLTVLQKPENKYLELSAGGMRNARGVELKTLHYVLLEPTDINGYALYDPVAGTQKKLLDSSVRYSVISPSPDMNWLLAAVPVQGPVRTELMYELLDQHGNSVAGFDYNEMYSPQWLQAEGSFLYIEGNADQRELVQYDAASHTREVVWQVPASNSRILAYDIDPRNGALAIAWGKYNHDSDLFDIQVETFAGIKDNSPKRHVNVGKRYCAETPCFMEFNWFNEQILFADSEGYKLLNRNADQPTALIKLSSKTDIPTIGVAEIQGKKWLVTMQEAEGKQDWIWNDGEQQISFATRVEFGEKGLNLWGPYNAGSTALFYAEDNGWLEINPTAKTAIEAKEMPETLLPELIIHQVNDKLIIGLQDKTVNRSPH